MNYSKDEILTQINIVMERLFELDKSELLPQAKLYEDLDIDSIDAVDLLIELKRFSGVDISPEKFKDAKTIQDLVDIIADL